MINSIDRLLSLQEAELIVRGQNGMIFVKYRDCWIRDSIFLRGAGGRGIDFHSACDDFLEQISGKKLVFNVSTENEFEVIVL